MRSVIEVYQSGRWVPAAEFVPGRQAYTATFEYLVDYVFSDSPQPVSLNLPVSLDRLGLDADNAFGPCPPFLLDLVPQGPGRSYLQQLLHQGDGEGADLLLAHYGAFNPIGNLRLNTAVQFYAQQSAASSQLCGFVLEEKLSDRAAFLETIWQECMLCTGTTGVQGAAPKFLLTQSHEGLWYADTLLPDAQASRHWLVKLPRGTHETDFAILRNEAAYLRVARACGLRIWGEAIHQSDMLFVPRFDRLVTSSGLERLHQESLASLAGLRGFGLPVTLFELVSAFAPHVTHLAREVAEFIKRDILNQALRNTDNHARNTAVQRLPDGTVQLTPLYDFAPMYLDREVIPRSSKWQIKGVELTEWRDIVGALSLASDVSDQVIQELRAFAEPLNRLPQIMQDQGVDPVIIQDCQARIDLQCQRLVL
ncbi:type II toxin-antitoxin system HipA family toxin [Uliginosibacterium gangwonense]|uniref:type II toxin-antitoxin system HipA family toxin n=1 Tax=Uliginosibacterium gangwonense TaxID=392736 RepID=UPI00037FF141|nr:type II toxin-antitoxin system HipA family toxin [Uliginosibacterium gangwonense]